MANVSIFKSLEAVCAVLPVPFYWMGADGTVLGLNDRCLEGMGAASAEDVIGKTPYDFYPSETAELILKHNQEVIRTGETLSQEERIEDITTGQVKYCIAIKSPLRDDDGNIIGIVGTSVETTAEKEAERLKLENALQKTKLEDEAKFRKVTEQVSHDIRSPLATLLMVLKTQEKVIPEKVRTTLRQAATGITEIANGLLSNYQKNTVATNNFDQNPQFILVYLLLHHVLSSKQLEYKQLLIQFTLEIADNTHFTFVQGDYTSFTRMLSNLINNAVESMSSQREGKVSLKLAVVDNTVQIVIQDTGAGMPPETINKIRNKVAFTAGKENGYGIGMTQVQDTLARYQGDLSIESELGKGTRIILNFLRSPAPPWIAEQLTLSKGDTVLILDDDPSIHSAWDMRLTLYRNDITIIHFEIGQDVIDFVNSLTPEKKSKVYLLTDYELLSQKLNGIDVIKQTQLKRVVLVTSHYNKQNLCQEAVQAGIKILPKEMAPDVPIRILEITNEHTNLSKTVDLVIVEDDDDLCTGLSAYFDSYNCRTVTYQSPYDLLNELDLYPKNTKISLDNDFGGKDLNGVQLARQLHEKGYTHLYMLSGRDFAEHELPPYLTFIPKTDTDLAQKFGF
ncbi:MAG: hypothetical protein K0S63_955 [Gammaproteobacteria bacterium]|jgi:PAS domain S-box-containing protein|nr:hypothetical protein [Gammaproteobacteria bacterium]